MKELIVLGGLNCAAILNPKKVNDHTPAARRMIKEQCNLTYRKQTSNNHHAKKYIRIGMTKSKKIVINWLENIPQKLYSSMIVLNAIWSRNLFIGFEQKRDKDLIYAI